MSKLLDGVDAIGEVCVLTAEVGKNIFKGPFEWDLIFEQLNLNYGQTVCDTVEEEVEYDWGDYGW